VRREALSPEPVAAAPEPTVIQPQIRPIARIVDPSVADEDDEAGPLFPESSQYGEERRQKGGWLSIFGGRPRHDAPAPSLRSTGSAQPASQPLAADSAADPDDLEIPSFLRRLAN
jgi:cell division protein FtsZ